MSVLARAGVLGALLALFFAADASAVTRVWDGGCGEDHSWSCAANWSEDADPGKEDTALFSSAATGNSTVDSEFAGTVGAVRINSGYTGTISLARGLQVLGQLKQVAGSFTAGSQSLQVKSFTLSGGSFTASSGTTSISGTLRITGEPTFSANGGTVEFNGGGGVLTCGEVVFNQVLFTHTTGTKTVGASCELPLGSNPSAGKGGGVTLNGILSGSGTLTAFKKLTLGATGELFGFSGLEASTLIVAGSYDFGEYEPFKVGSDFKMNTGASVVAPADVASLGRSFTIESGASFDANEGEVKLVSKASFVLSCNSQVFASVVFESTGPKTIGSDCTLPLGSSPSLGVGRTVLNGALEGTGTLTQTGTLEIGSSEPGFDSFTNVYVDGTLRLMSTAGFTAPKGTTTVRGNFTVDEGATFDANEGTVDFEAAYRSTRSLSCGGVSFYAVVLTNKGKQVVGGDCTLPLGAEPTIGGGGEIEVNGTLVGTGTMTTKSPLLTLGSTGGLSGFSGLSSGALKVAGVYDFGEYAPLAVDGDFTIVSGGEVVAPEGDTEISGDFVNGGSFEANGGAVLLVGGDQAIGGSTTFDDLTKIAVEAETLTFAVGSTQTVKGALTLEGFSAGKRLSLVSSKAGEAWNLAGAGSRTAKWLSVKDSNNSGTEVEAVESVDGGGNTGWSF